ncbi:MAG: 50S ribosomal protein L10, partial [Euryarchaeota archaeon HGW-Euryarchaeota-1]
MTKKIALKKINKAAKSKQLETLKNDLLQYSTIATIDIENLTSEQIMNLRKAIKGKDIVIFGGRKNLITKVFDEAGNKTATQMLKQTKTKSLLALSNKSPFTLTLLLDKEMQPAPAKEGAKALDDVVVPKGKTSQKPGPAISSFTQAGVKTGIEQGFIAVKDDTTVTKKGDVVSAAVMKLLTMLGIKPFKQGFYIKQAANNNQIFDESVLHINIEQFTNDVSAAVGRANSLCVSAGILTPHSVKILVQKA